MLSNHEWGQLSLPKWTGQSTSRHCRAINAVTHTLIQKAYPLAPRRTKIPNFGISSVRSEIAVTNPLLRRKMDVLKVFFRFRIEMAISGDMVRTSSFLVFQKAQEFFEGSCASYSRRSSNTARDGHKKMSI